VDYLVTVYQFTCLRFVGRIINVLGRKWKFIYSKYISADGLNVGYPAVFWVKKQMVTTVHTDIYWEGYSVVTNMEQYIWLNILSYLEVANT